MKDVILKELTHDTYGRTLTLEQQMIVCRLANEESLISQQVLWVANGVDENRIRYLRDWSELKIKLKRFRTEYTLFKSKFHERKKARQLCGVS